ncbi:helix-turn-helix domain-containing protein [Peptoniphilus sp. GNH]|nr:helix-turn-helix domain-containing protein [Peptoniphilus sp. GNH]
MEKSYYAIIPANIRYDDKLTANAKLLYGEITALCNEKGYCKATNSYFAELYKVSKRAISNWIALLEDCGYIKTKIIDNNERLVFINLNDVLNDNTLENPFYGEENFMPSNDNSTIINDNYPRKNVLYPRKNVLYPRKNVLYPRKNVLYPRKNVLYPRKNVLYPRKNILYPRKNVLYPRKNVLGYKNTENVDNNEVTEQSTPSDDIYNNIYNNIINNNNSIVDDDNKHNVNIYKCEIDKLLKRKSTTTQIKNFIDEYSEETLKELLDRIKESTWLQKNFGFVNLNDDFLKMILVGKYIDFTSNKGYGNKKKSAKGTNSFHNFEGHTEDLTADEIEKMVKAKRDKLLEQIESGDAENDQT